MNKGNLYFILLIFSISFLPYTGTSQSVSIKEIFKTQNFNLLTAQMDDEIDLCIMDDTQINTKAEALQRLTSFSKSKDFQKIEELHNGKSGQLGSTYNVYKITTPNEVLRAFVYFEGESSSLLIKEVRIDKF